MSDDKPDQQPTDQKPSVEEENQQSAQNEATEQSRAEPDPEFIKQAETELAQTKSTWSDIDGVISYDAESQTQTQKTITQPDSVRPQPESGQTDPARDAEVAAISPDTDAIHNTAADEIVNPHPAQQQQVSGVTNSARVVTVVRVVVKTTIAAAVVAAGWYAYKMYL